MKKIILSILFIAFVFAAIGQNLKGYNVEALQKLEAKRAFVLGGDSVYATTKMIPEDTIIVTKLFLESEIDSASIAMQEPDSIGQFPVWNPDSGFFIMDNVYNYVTQTDLQNLEHSSTNNLGWTESGHTSSANKIAAFDATGAATTLDTITNLASQYDLTLKQPQLNGTGFVKASGTTISYDNSTYVTTNTTQTVSGSKTFSSSLTYFGNTGVESGIKISSTNFPQIQFANVSDTRLLYRNGNNLIWRYDGTNNGNLYHSGNSNLSSVNWAANNITAAGTIQGTTANLTNLTDGYLPYHVSDASGLASSNVSIPRTNVLRINTGNTQSIDFVNQPSGTIELTNIDIVSMPTISGKVNSTNAGLWFQSLTVDANSRYDMMFNIRENDNTDYSDLTRVGFRWARLGTTLMDLKRNGELSTISTIQATTAKLTNLTDNYIPKHTSDAIGLENSNIFFSGNIARYGTANTFSNDRDIVDKAYVDAIAAGNMPKLPVDAATTGNITLSGTQTIDGYSAVAGSRILVWKQTTTSQNGVYIVASGAWTRATDLDTWAELYKAYVTVLNGAQSGSSFVCTVPSTGTLGTDPVTWILYNAPTNITVSSPLAKSGNNISLGYDTNTLEVATGNLKVKDNVFQPLLNGTGFVKASGTTITYDNSTYLTAETDPIFAADSANLLHWSDTLNTTKGIATAYDLSLKQNTLTTGNLTENVTGLQFDNTRQVIGGSAQLSLTSGYFIPTTTEQTNWNTAYTDRMKWDGGATGLVAATGRTSLGANAIGSNIFTSGNPSAITFLRANADNTVTWLDAASFRTAIGAGTSSTNGTVTSVSMTVPTGFSISGSPVTSSGTLGLTYALGYSLPTTASQSNWDAAYSWGNHAVAGYLTQSSFNSGNADLAAIEALAGTSGLLRKTAANTWSLDNSPYLTANQTITLSGNVTGSGTTSIATTISNSAITASMLNATDATSGYFLRYVPAGSGLDWEPINFVPQTRTLTINGTTYDLSANRSWTVSASPAGSNTQVQYNNLGSLGASANFTFNSGTGVVTATNFQLGSDRRYKIKIRKLSELEWVDDIQFVSFRMKQNKKIERYGVIAQDIEKINPNLVSENADGYKAVSYTDLLIAKVARQDQKIKSLEERLEMLEKELHELLNKDNILKN